MYRKTKPYLVGLPPPEVSLHETSPPAIFPESYETISNTGETGRRSAALPLKKMGKESTGILLRDKCRA